MPRLTKQVPKYRHHRASGQAIVTIAGKDHYLGKYRSKASEAEYERLIGEWLAAGRPDQVAGSQTDLTVVEVCAAYLKFANGYYRKDGELTRAIYGIRATIKLLKGLYGPTPAIEFGPLALKAIQNQMIDENRSRRYINDTTERIKRMFRWAVSEEMLPPSTFQALATVPGLRRGRTQAREMPPVQPVEQNSVEATLKALPAVLADMVRFQLLTGCRPGELCIVRPCDIDATGDVWAYRPESHKTQHHGRERVIFIGPQCQKVLRPYLLREKAAFCFSPIDSEKARRQDASAKRQTPANYGNRPGSNRKRKPKRTAGLRYTVDSYRRAIRRACKKVKVDAWSPNRLRHSAATEIRRRFGLEAAQVTLGHASADVSQIYAERDFDKAKDVMRKVG